MKHLKRFENDLEPKVMKMPKKEIITLLEDYLVDLYFDYDDDDVIDLDECPFVTELATLHQRDYFEEIYDDWNQIKKMNISKIEFLKICDELIENAKKKIKKFIEEDPTLLKYTDDDEFDIYQTRKYNL
jgi:hypothetical protein